MSDKVTKLRSALKQYGQHLTGCRGLLYHGRHHPFGDCSCGFNQVAIDCGLRKASYPEGFVSDRGEK